VGRMDELQLEKMIVNLRQQYHEYLQERDPDYRFECAVMGEAATQAKYSVDQLWLRINLLPAGPLPTPLAHWGNTGE